MTNKKAGSKSTGAKIKSAARKKKSLATGARPEFDKYFYYRRAVQAPDTDVKFLRDVYREHRKRDPITLREDFCGTHAICCEWAKLNPKHQALGIDIDAEPILYGATHYQPKLTPSQRNRVKVLQADVLNPGLPKADLICAMNFSHYVFKDRGTMKSYFHNAHTTLEKDGVLVVDCFGGSQCQTSIEEKTDHNDFIYFWDQTSFDPISSEALFHIHFKLKGQKKIEKVFTYDWRMWSIPELREMMLETGFRKTFVYWEGTTRSGKGDGNFKVTEKGEECLAWIAYVAAVK